MIAILSATIIFSFFSMFHCAMMCGPLKLSLIKGPAGNSLYHLGRMTSYLSLALFMHYGALSTISRFQQDNSWWVFLILSLIVFSLIYVLAQKYYFKANVYIGNHFVNRIQKIKSPKLKAFSIGMLTGILPCGVLYAFLLSMAMVEKVEVLLIGVMIFVVITGVGVNASSLILSKLASRLRINKRIFTMLMVLISYGFLINRFIGKQIIGMCFS